MRTKFVFIFILWALFSQLCKAQNKATQQIKHMLAQQVVAWNNGNIEGYMHGYWENDSLLFIGSKGPRYGYKVTLAKYKESYPDKEHMGQLTSTITRIQKLNRKHYFVIGKWELNRTMGNLSGSYTLLIKKIDHQWVIIADHSS